MKARGTFDKVTQTLTVADEGDYIETSPKQDKEQEKEQPQTSILEPSKISGKMPQQNYVDQEQEKEQSQTSILEPSEISRKMLQQNYVDNVSDVALKPDQQTYSVQGVKRGKLFFLISVKLNIQLEVDATTGVVKAIKKPWWSFLVW